VTASPRREPRARSEAKPSEVEKTETQLLRS